MWKHTLEKSHTNATHVNTEHASSEASDLRTHSLSASDPEYFDGNCVFHVGSRPLTCLQMWILDPRLKILMGMTLDLQGGCVIRMQTYLLLLFSWEPQVVSCSQPNRRSVPIAGANPYIDASTPNWHGGVQWIILNQQSWGASWHMVCFWCFSQLSTSNVMNNIKFNVWNVGYWLQNEKWIVKWGVACCEFQVDVVSKLCLISHAHLSMFFQYQ